MPSHNVTAVQPNTAYQVLRKKISPLTFAHTHTHNFIEINVN